MQKIKNWLWIIVANMVYAFGVTVFVVPGQFAPGGITGLATMANAALGLPIGAVTLCLNLPLILLAFRKISKQFVLATLCAVAVFSLASDVLFAQLPVFTGDRMLASLFGGVLMGIGFGMTMRFGASTGGTDILGILILKRFPHFSIGNLLLGFDVVIILSSLLIFREAESGMYAIINMLVASKMMDMIIYGVENGKMVLLVSEQCDTIAGEIIATLDRSATVFTAEGAYSKTDKRVLISAVDNKQLAQAKQIIRRVDPKAFAVTVGISSVDGEGWMRRSIDHLYELQENR